MYNYGAIVGKHTKVLKEYIDAKIEEVKKEFHERLDAIEDQIKTISESQAFMTKILIGMLEELKK